MPPSPARKPETFVPYHRANIERAPEWALLDDGLQRALRVVSTVLPFRTNAYVLRELIDWTKVPDDPIFQLTFLQEEMLEPEQFARMARLLELGAGRSEIEAAANEIRRTLNPHPGGQSTHNVPSLDGRPLAGMQHKYRETVLFFPSAGQTCHAYCTFCFRWPQFVGLDDQRFGARETDDLVAYLRAHTEVRDLLLTGGDPMVLRASVLRRYLRPILEQPGLEHVRTVRIGTKSLAYWPHRFLDDPDADELLRLLESVVASGRHLAIMAHYTHPRELSTPVAEAAVRRLRATGAQIRMQAPLVRRVNDDPAAWASLWQRGVELGCVPYYLFVERDTGPKAYFEVPLERAWSIFRDAYQRVSGLGRTVRGPVMSALPGKVKIDGVCEIGGEKVFALQFLQARRPDWVRRPFFARFDPRATWLDQLVPAFGEGRFFFERERPDLVPSWRQGSGGQEAGAPGPGASEVASSPALPTPA